MKRFHVIVAISPKHLEEKVNEKLDEGYLLYGYPFVYGDVGGIFQCMTFYGEDAFPEYDGEKK